MAQPDQGVFAVFTSKRALESAVERLREGGFGQEEISILFRGPGEPEAQQDESRSRGITAGVTSGALLGGALGCLAGIATSVLQGIWVLIISGPLMGLLSGAALGGALGGFTGVLTGVEVTRDALELHQHRLERGEILLAIRASPERLARARSLLSASEAKEVVGPEQLSHAAAG